MATFESDFNGLRGGLCPSRAIAVAGRSFGHIRRPAVGCTRHVPSPLPVEPSTPSVTSVGPRWVAPVTYHRRCRPNLRPRPPHQSRDCPYCGRFRSCCAVARRRIPSNSALFRLKSCRVCPTCVSTVSEGVPCKPPCPSVKLSCRSQSRPPQNCSRQISRQINRQITITQLQLPNYHRPKLQSADSRIKMPRPSTWYEFAACAGVCDRKSTRPP